MEKQPNQGAPLWGDPLNDLSASDQAITFMELIRERAFIGAIPSDTIFERITTQFEDYINMEDQANYVDIFYNQLALSYDRVNSDDSEEHPVEIREALDLIHQRFIDLMQRLFYERLTIAIADLEAGVVHREDLEFIIRRLYEFFILGARNNFKVVIAANVNRGVANLGELDDNAYFQAVQSEMELYSPLITSITPTEFLRYRGDEEVYELFENGRVNGNFLRKYSPKLYQNDDFAVELVNHITMVHSYGKEFRDEVLDTTPVLPVEEKEPELEQGEEAPLEEEPPEIDLTGIDIAEDIGKLYNQEEENSDG